MCVMRIELDGTGWWMRICISFSFGLMGNHNNVDTMSIPNLNTRCKLASYAQLLFFFYLLRSPLPPPILPSIQQPNPNPPSPHTTPLNHLPNPNPLTPLFPFFGPVNPGLAVTSYGILCTPVSVPAPAPAPAGKAAVAAAVALSIKSDQNPVPL